MKITKKLKKFFIMSSMVLMVGLIAAPAATPQPVVAATPTTSSTTRCKHKSTKTVSIQTATCTRKPKWKTVCRSCGKTIKTSTGSAFGHNWVRKNQKVGKYIQRIQKCSRCGATRADVPRG